MVLFLYERLIRKFYVKYIIGLIVIFKRFDGLESIIIVMIGLVIIEVVIDFK